MAQIFPGVPRKRRTLFDTLRETPSAAISFVPFIGSLAATVLLKPAELERANARADAAHHFIRLLAVRGKALPREPPLHAAGALSQNLRLPTAAEARSRAASRKAFETFVERQQTISRTPHISLGLARRPHLDLGRTGRVLEERRRLGLSKVPRRA